ncbi:MAG: 2-hydroxychromene-2-carboxylate isomerase [Paracoccaceae bacterium]
MRSVDFWVSIGSTYSYLAVMRVEDAAKAAGVPVRWRVFDVRSLLVRQKNIPFADKPAKLAHMWRDIGRRAVARGLSPQLPAPYPIADLARANRVALLGLREGWGQDYIRGAYRLWFEQGRPPGEAPALPMALEALGLDAAAVMARAEAPEIAQALAAETEAAEAAGLFGVPSFTVGSELFWGDDRLEDALAWAREGRLPPG